MNRLALTLLVASAEAVRKMGWHQLDKRLTDEEVNSIVAFLNALTDKNRVADKSRASK